MAQTKSIRRLICGLAISLQILMLPGLALAHGIGGRAAVIVGGYQVSPTFEDPARTGENFLHVQILDGMGLPVRGAQVLISAMPVEDAQSHQGSMEGMESGTHVMGDMGGMHGMQGMAPASAPAAVSAKEIEGEYVGVITFPAAGHWRLNTHLMINDQMLNADFPVEVGSASSPFAIVMLIAFIGLNAFIIWVASFTKRKPVAA